MTLPQPGRLLGEGLTKAAEALAGGSDEMHLHDAALHLTRALGASSVAILAVVREGESLHLIADSDEHRSDADLGAMLTAPALRRALVSGEVLIARDFKTRVPGETDAEADRVGAEGTWAVFPIVLRRKPRGVLVARLPYNVGELPDAVTLCGRAAAALVAVILPGAKVLDPIKERTRKITLIDVPRERRLRAIERYRSFIDSASDGIVVLDATGTVLYMNRAAEQVTGYARDGLAGRSWAQVVPEAQRPILWNQLAHATQARPVRKPARNMTVSVAPWSADICRASTAPNNETLLMSPRSQRKSRAVTQDTPWWRCSAVGGFSTLLIMNTVGVMSLGITWSRGATPRVTWIYTSKSPAPLCSARADTSLRQRSSHSAPVCGFAMRNLDRLRLRRAMCSSKRNSLRLNTGTTSYTPSPKMNPRSSTETLASRSEPYSPFR